MNLEEIKSILARMLIVNEGMFREIHEYMTSLLNAPDSKIPQ